MPRVFDRSFASKFGWCAVALALAVAGCGDSDGGGASGGEELSMQFIPYNTGNPYFDRLGVGMKEAAASSDAEYSTAGPATANPTAQVPFIKDGQARGVDVLSIYANDPQSMTPLLSSLRDRGVTVLAMGADIDEEARDAAILATDNDAVGPLLVDLMVKQLGKPSGEIGIVSGTPESPDHNYWIAGMRKYIASTPELKDLKIVKVVHGNEVPDQINKAASSLLTQYPDLDGIIAPTTTAVAGTAQVVKSAGKSGKVAVTGLGLPSQMAPYVLDGTVEEFALWDPADMGRVAACIGAAAQKEKVAIEPNASFDCPKLGKRKVEADGTVIAGDLITFDEKNVESAGF